MSKDAGIIENRISNALSAIINPITSDKLRSNIFPDK